MPLPQTTTQKGLGFLRARLAGNIFETMEVSNKYGRRGLGLSWRRLLDMIFRWEEVLSVVGTRYI